MDLKYVHPFSGKKPQIVLYLLSDRTRRSVVSGVFKIADFSCHHNIIAGVCEPLPHDRLRQIVAISRGRIKIGDSKVQSPFHCGNALAV